MHKILLYIFVSFIIPLSLFAQDTLPDFTVTQLGRKVLVSWNNPYITVSHINIQRSGDSTKNFTSIGTVLNVDAPVNGFVDTKEFIPSREYYRLFISFKGGTYTFTEAKQPAPDTSNIAEEIVEIKPQIKTWFVASKHVYTGKNNNVIISLPNADKNNYSIKFYEDDGTFLFEIKHIPESYLILDKVNFIHSGLFRFELFQNRLPIEIHKIYIPKDGEQAPALDVNGYEVK